MFTKSRWMAFSAWVGVDSVRDGSGDFRRGIAQVCAVKRCQIYPGMDCGGVFRLFDACISGVCPVPMRRLGECAPGGWYRPAW